MDALEAACHAPNVPVSKTGMGFQSIGGSNPPLSVRGPSFPSTRREFDSVRAGTETSAPRSTQANAGLIGRSVIPPAIPPSGERLT